MTNVVERGLTRQLQSRRDLLAAGHHPIGWKAAFGAPASLEKFGLDGPLLGFMTDHSIVESGAEVDVSSWVRPIAEPEIAVFVGQDISPGASEEEAVRAISALGPAIELVDIFQAPDDLEASLAVNVFHRSVVLGERDSSRAGADLSGLEAIVALDGVEVGTTADLEELTGHIASVISYLSGVLAPHGERIRAGEIVICGSIVPPVSLATGNSFHFELRPFPAIAVTTAP